MTTGDAATQRKLIERGYDARATLTPDSADDDLRGAVEDAVAALGAGTARIAEPVDGGWQVNEWLKKAVLLYFRLHDNRVMPGAGAYGYDKVPLRFSSGDESELRAAGARIVPPAVVRHGAFIERGAVLMPCYVNIGARVGAGAMIDTWATVGSCAQIGRNVHISGGAGIGGVLEPLQASPTIIEDDCFIGARSEIVEGVIVERGAVVSMGVFVGQSTRIYDREKDSVSYGRIPAGAVVVAGSLPADNGRYSLNCAVIVKRVDAKTRAKVGINALLRED